MSTSSPLVSICVPNFNNAAYLAQAIQSALQQTIQDLEVIVCDNQSTDNSLEVAQSFDDPRVHVYSNERNLGIYGNFARTTEYARGRYLKFLCADDWLDPQYLEVTLSYFAQYPEVGLVTTRQQSVNNSGEVITIRYEAIKGKEIYSPMEYLAGIPHRINPIGNPSRVIVTRDAFDNVGGFDPTNEYAGDLDLWLRLGTSFSIAAVPNVYSYERRHAKQATKLHVRQGTDIRDVCLALQKNIETMSSYWALQQRIALCRYGLAPQVRHAIRTFLKGDIYYWKVLTDHMSKICPFRYWVPYHLLVFPYISGKLALYSLAKKFGIKRHFVYRSDELP